MSILFWRLPSSNYRTFCDLDLGVGVLDPNGLLGIYTRMEGATRSWAISKLRLLQSLLFHINIFTSTLYINRPLHSLSYLMSKGREYPVWLIILLAFLALWVLATIGIAIWLGAIKPSGSGSGCYKPCCY